MALKLGAGHDGDAQHGFGQSLVRTTEAIEAAIAEIAESLVEIADRVIDISEELEIFPYPGLHSEVDILIHFSRAQVLCMGDLLLSQSCPAIRDAAAYLELLDKVLDVFPPRTTFVSGHGGDLSAAGLRKYRTDMAEMARLVKKEFAAGRSAEDMVRADLLKGYKAEYSHLDWLGPDSWIRTVVRGLQASAGR